MKILLIKTSSLGDVIHTLPAITDLKTQYPEAEIHWIVEKNFSEIPSWHKGVDKVIGVPWRYWVKNPSKAFFSQEFKDFYKTLRQTHYDYVVDAQGLVKSALITALAKGEKHGFGYGSAREFLALLSYQKRHKVSWDFHAVERVRQLFANIFQYDHLQFPLNYGLNKALFTPHTNKDYILFLHGTTWETKHWPESYWKALAQIISKEGLNVYIPWGNETEQARALRIAAVAPNNVRVLPKSTLKEMAGYIVSAKAVVAVDTGLGHLSAALHQKTLSLYGPTDANRTGTYGLHQQHLQSKASCSPCLKRQCPIKRDGDVLFPCYDTVTPDMVWQQLKKLLPAQEALCD